MVKAPLALSDAAAQTLTRAEKIALTRRAFDLRNELRRTHNGLHPIAQLVNTAQCFNSYAMKHAALSLWESADDKQKAAWVRECEYELRSILWHERYIPGVREMLTRLVTTNKAYDFSDVLDAPHLTLDFTVPTPPITHRPRPDYLRVVQAEAGGD